MAEAYGLKQVEVRLKLCEGESLYSTEEIYTPSDAIRVMRDAIAQMDREYCCVVNLDTQNRPINFNIVAIGDIDSTNIPMQNVFKSAILSNAAKAMLLHNHPSGSLVPSRPDVDVTKRLIEAGRLMNIPVIDHIIVAPRTAEHYSFRSIRPELFDSPEHEAMKVREVQEVREESVAYVPTRIGNSFVRPCKDHYAVYLMTSLKTADTLFEGTQKECYDWIENERMEMDARRIILNFTAKTEDLFDCSKVDGMDVSEIESDVWGVSLFAIASRDLDATIGNVLIIGSRARGFEREDSDLDVLICYSGGASEEEVASALKDEEMTSIGGVRLDLIPVNATGNQSIALRLINEERRLSEKQKGLARDGKGSEKPSIHDRLFEKKAEADRRESEIGPAREKEPKREGLSL